MPLNKETKPKINKSIEIIPKMCISVKILKNQFLYEKNKLRIVIYLQRQFFVPANFNLGMSQRYSFFFFFPKFHHLFIFKFHYLFLFLLEVNPENCSKIILIILVLWPFKIWGNLPKFSLFEFSPILVACILKLDVLQALVRLFF